MKRRKPTHKGLKTRLSVSEWSGLAIVDAKDDLEIEVTANDIKRGARKSLGDCAFALACRGKFDSRKVQFMHHRAYLDLPVEFNESERRVVRRVERFLLPASTRRFVERFDKGEKVEAGVYKLRAPRASQTLAAIATRRGNHRKGKPHPRKPRTVRAHGFIRSGTGVMKMKRVTRSEDV